MLPVLRLRFALHFREKRKWNRFVAEQVALPTWSFEAAERGDIVFVRSQEPLAGHEAVARLFLRSDPDAPPAEVEVALRGRWGEQHERDPPLGAVQDWVEEAVALLVLLGAHAPHAMFSEAYRTRK